MSRSLIDTVFDEFSSFVALLGLDASDTPVRKNRCFRIPLWFLTS